MRSMMARGRGDDARYLNVLSMGVSTAPDVNVRT
jgi:hypothetical protein